MLCFNWHACASCHHSSMRYSRHLASCPMPVLGGVSDAEKRHLARLDSEARVNAVFAQVLAMVNARRACGGVAVDAPVLSRLHQELSAGMHGFQQACKLEDTPFPFVREHAPRCARVPPRSALAHLFLGSEAFALPVLTYALPAGEN